MDPKRKHRLLNEADGGGSTGGGAVAVEAPAAAPAAPAAPAASASAAPAQAPAAGAHAPAASTAQAPAAKGGASSAPAATAAAPAAGEGKPAEKGADEKPGDWAPDWRDKIAGGDEKLTKLMSRYASPAEVAKALQAAQIKISSGELKPVLGKNASAEEVTEYRKAHGIPEDPTKYDLGKDVQVEERDQEAVGILLKTIHGTNATPEQAKATVKALYEIRKANADKQAESDSQALSSAEDALRAEWGGEYRRNAALIDNLLDSVIEPGMKDLLLNGRLKDGTPIIASQHMLKGLLRIALINSPAGTLVGPNGADPAKSVDEEIAAIEKTMRENRPAYNKDEKMQARFRELLSVREQLNQRAKQ
jgi:hypothetical protein